MKSISKWDSIDSEILNIDKKVLDEMELQNALNNLLDATQTLINMGSGDESELKKTKNDIQESIDNESKLKLKKEEFKEMLKDINLKNEVVEYRTNFQFRSKNALGALVLNSAYIRLGKDMKVLDISINEPEN